MIGLAEPEPERELELPERLKMKVNRAQALFTFDLF